MKTYFQRLEKKPVINEESDIPDDSVTNDTRISVAILSIGECKKILIASRVESFTHLGKNLEGHSTQLFRRAFLKYSFALSILIHLALLLRSSSPK